MKTWNEYYSKKISWKNYLEKLADHSHYLEKVIELNPSSTLEVGCGPGTRSVFLSYLGINAKAIDIDEKIMDQVSAYNRKFKGSLITGVEDAFNLPYRNKEFDVIFNAGFLEHFHDSDKIKLVKEFTRVAKYYIFIVPNKNYRLRPYGNEDLLTKKQWDNILSDFEIIESYDIQKIWSNSLFRRVFEVFMRILGYDIRQNVMYYCKLKARD